MTFWPLIRLLPKETHFRFVSLAPIAAALSGLLVLASCASFVIIGLNLGIDFKGGTLIEVTTPGPAPLGQLRAALNGYTGGFADGFQKSGRSPAEVPPNWPEEVQEAQKDYAAKLDRMIVCCEVLEEVEETEGLDAETIQNARDNALFATAEHQRTLDVLLAAVWRSAQQ